MLIDMHIHTSFSACSTIRVLQIAEKIRDARVDGVCITDHDTAAALSQVGGLSDSTSKSIIVGLEYTTNQGDFLIFGPVEAVPQEMDARALLQWVTKAGGVAIPAHPFRKSRPVDTRILHYFDVIEVLNGRNQAQENDMCAQWIEMNGNGRKGIGGSDAHTPDEIGRIVTVFNKDIYTADDLVRELRDGDFAVKQLYP